MGTSVRLVCAIVLLPLSLLSQQLSPGGTARSVALGGGPANPYLRDIIRVHINPALQNSAPNLIWSDVGYGNVDRPQGGSSGQFLAVTVKPAADISVGLLFNKRESPLYNTDPSYVARDPIDEFNSYEPSVLGFVAQSFGRPLSPVEFMGSYRVGTFDVGAAASYGGWSAKRSGQDDLSLRTRSVRGKLGVVASPSATMAFDAAILLADNLVDGTYTPSGGSKSSMNMDGGTELGFDARGIRDLDEQWSAIVVGRVYWFSWGMNQTKNGVAAVPNPASKYSHSEYEIGLGFNFRKNALLIAGGMSYQAVSVSAEYRSQATSYKTTTVTTDVPKIDVGAEFQLASWMALRLGYFDRIGSTETTTENAGAKTVVTASGELPWYGDLNGLTAGQQRLTIGIGVCAAGFAIDGTIGEGFFLSGPWLLTGVQQQLFMILSVSYQL